MQATRRYATSLLLGLGLLAGAASAADKPLPAGTFAVVNGVNLPQSALDQLILSSGMQDSAQTRLIAKNQLIARELFRQEAVKANLANRPDVQAAVKEATDNVLTQYYLKGAIKPAAVSEADVQAEYQKVVGSLGEKEYKLAMIQVADDATAQKLLAELRQGKAFDALARQHSQAPSRANGGELDWVSFKTPLTEGHTAGLPLPMAEAATKLAQGAVSKEPLAIGNARVILKMVQVRPTKIPKFDEVKGAIQARMQNQALQVATTQLVVNLLKAAQIQQ